jgi:hypothetical protein
MSPAGEMWSVVIESPSTGQHARAGMSMRAGGVIVMPSK